MCACHVCCVVGPYSNAYEYYLSSELEHGPEAGPVQGQVELVAADLELLPSAPQVHPQPASPVVALAQLPLLYSSEEVRPIQCGGRPFYQSKI